MRLAIVLALAACTPADHHGPITPKPTGSGTNKPGPPGPSAAGRARGVLDQQLARALALVRGQANGVTLDELFDPAAVLWTPTTMTVENGVGTVGMFAADPHDQVLDATIENFVAGGDNSVAWMTFEVAATVKHADGSGDVTTSITRGSELLTAESNWKIVSAAFDRPHAPCPCQPPLDVPALTDPGPLAVFVDPAKMAHALRDDANVAVLGLDRDRAIGAPAVRQLLVKLASGEWNLNGKPHEVHGKTWAVLDANLDLGPVPSGKKFPLRVGLELYAIPTARGDWQVIAAHYLPLD